MNIFTPITSQQGVIEMKIKDQSEDEAIYYKNSLTFNGSNLIEHHNDENFIKLIKEIDDLMKDIAISNKVHFDITDAKNNRSKKAKCSPEGHKLIKLIRQNILLIPTYFCKHATTPRVYLFFRILRRRLEAITSAIKSGLTINELSKITFILVRALHWMQYVMRHTKFKRAVRSHENTAQQNLRSVVKYIIALFKKHSRLLILRIDLYFLKKYYESITPQLNRVYLDKFLRALSENRIVPDVVGYISTTEFGYIRGFHQHVFIALNSNEHQRDIFLTEEIGKYWTNCTDQKGNYNNCAKRKDEYKYCGIGMVHVSETDKLKGIRLAIAYMVKGDYYVKTLLEKQRTLRKGLMPKMKNKMGAPRKNPEDTANMCLILQGKF